MFSEGGKQSFGKKQGQTVYRSEIIVSIRDRHKKTNKRLNFYQNSHKQKNIKDNYNSLKDCKL